MPGEQERVKGRGDLGTVRTSKHEEVCLEPGHRFLETHGW